MGVYLFDFEGVDFLLGDKIGTKANGESASIYISKPFGRTAVLDGEWEVLASPTDCD